MAGYFYFYNHQNKGVPLIEALKKHGWVWTGQSGQARIVFSDTDIRPKLLQHHYRSGKLVFIYPHAARPNLYNDFKSYPPSEYVTAQFVVSDGHVEIMRRYGHPHTLVPIGWYLCPIKPFQPRPNPRKILFAPIHPNVTGLFSDTDRQINIDAFKILLALAKEEKINLTIRYVRDLEANGLWRERVEGVSYVQGHTDGNYSDIDQADLVVSHQTYAHMAVARGVPTVMMGESIPPRVGCAKLNTFEWCQSWEKYKDLLMYPFDILTCDDPMELFERAGESDAGISDWRRRMIGEPFDPEVFVKIVEGYL